MGEGAAPSTPATEMKSSTKCKSCEYIFPVSLKVRFCAACGAPRPSSPIDDQQAGDQSGSGKAVAQESKVRAIASSASSDERLPDGWCGYRTPEGHRYFHHASSGRTQWEFPRA